MKTNAKYAGLNHDDNDVCECSDFMCPACAGTCHTLATATLYRVDMDMQDETGTRMCENCADDAMASGLFVEED